MSHLFPNLCINILTIPLLSINMITPLKSYMNIRVMGEANSGRRGFLACCLEIWVPHRCSRARLDQCGA